MFDSVGSVENLAVPAALGEGAAVIRGSSFLCYLLQGTLDLDFWGTKCLSCCAADAGVITGKVNSFPGCQISMFCQSCWCLADVQNVSYRVGATVQRVETAFTQFATCRCL